MGVNDEYNSWQLEDHLHDHHLLTQGQLDEMDSQKMRSVHAAEHFLGEADHKHTEAKVGK